MNVIVETYECEETATETPEMTIEALRIIESAGLEGQQELVATPDGANIERVPYREMTKEELRVWEILCPNRCNVEDYKAGPIPIRVLQVISHAKSLEVFDQLRVWDKEGSEIKDPVVVGRIGQHDEYGDRRQFILARWGEELEEWPALLRKASVLAKERLISAAAKIKAQLAAYCAEVEAMGVHDALHRGTPSFFGH